MGTSRNGLSQDTSLICINMSSSHNICRILYATNTHKHGIFRISYFFTSFPQFVQYWTITNLFSLEARNSIQILMFPMIHLLNFLVQFRVFDSFHCYCAVSVLLRRIAESWIEEEDQCEAKASCVSIVEYLHLCLLWRPWPVTVSVSSSSCLLILSVGTFVCVSWRI